MAHPKISNEDLIGRVAEVFRTQGYERASLSRISDATGLEKASLYHRFPGGKEAMAVAVVSNLNQWFQEQVFTPLERSGNPVEKVRFVAQRLREFYADGRKPCAIDTLSLPGGSGALQKALLGSLTAWLQAFAGIAREAGASGAEAREHAEQAIIEIQGSLVLARVLGDCKPFHRTIDRLPDLLVGPGNR